MSENRPKKHVILNDGTSLEMVEEDLSFYDDDGPSLYEIEHLQLLEMEMK